MRILSILILFSFLASCTHGPEKSQLKSQIVNLVGQKFGPELFSIESLSRRGSHKHSNGDITVYFRVDLKLLKPIEFGKWDKLDVSGLITLLGAASGGLKGIQSGGNKPGDILTIYGSSQYKKTSSGWEFKLAPSSTLSTLGKLGVINDLEAEKKVDFSKLPVNQRYLKILQNNFKILNKSGKAAVEQSLRETVLNSIVWAGAEKNAQGIAAGEQGGEYFHFVKAFENIGDSIVAYETLGSGHNIRLVSSGAVKYGLAQSDMLQNSKLLEYTKNISAVVALFPEAVHVITMASSRIVKISDLKGTRVSIGTKLSGSARNAKDLLRTHLINPTELQLTYNGLSDSLAALRSGKTDAMIFTGSFPMATLDFFMKKNDVRFVKIDQKRLSSLTSNILLTIPRKSYPGQDEEYRTFGTTAVIITNSSNDRAAVKSFLNQLFTSQKRVAQTAPKALNLDRTDWDTGIFGNIHLGAKDYFFEEK